MNVIIAGSRRLEGHPDLDALIAQAVADSGFDVTAVFSGCARGADLAGEKWAQANDKMVCHWPYISHLGKYGGFQRNAQMAHFADALILVRYGDSKGSGHMLTIAKKRGIPFHDVVVDATVPA